MDTLRRLISDEHFDGIVDNNPHMLHYLSKLSDVWSYIENKPVVLNLDCDDCHNHWKKFNIDDHIMKRMHDLIELFDENCSRSISVQFILVKEKSFVKVRDLFKFRRHVVVVRAGANLVSALIF